MMFLLIFGGHLMLVGYSKTRNDTIKHIKEVQKILKLICQKLEERGEKHDSSKLKTPEIEVFATVDQQTKDLKYGSAEYNKSLEDLLPALQHHYAKNRHHPEHFPNGIKGMNIIDLVEVLADWKASAERYKEGNILKSIETNIERFNISDDLASILRNSVELFELLD